MPYVNPEASSLFEQGYGTDEVVRRKIKTSEGKPCSLRTAQRWKQYCDQGVADTIIIPGNREISQDLSDIEVTLLTKLTKNKFATLRDLSTSLDRSEASVREMLYLMQERGYNIEIAEDSAHSSTKHAVLPIDVIDDPIADSSIVRLAVASDWHMGSIEEQHTHLMEFLNYALRKGYRDFAFPGDLTEGLRMRVGHEHGMYVHTADAIEELLRRPFDLLSEYGATAYVIGGNHDFSIIKNCSTDPIWRVCQRYDNVKFLGYDVGDIPITDKVSVRMFHPDGAGVNPVGKIQKAMNALALEELTQQLSALENQASNVRILLVGHLHISSKMRQGSRIGYQVSCFQGNTDFLMRHSLIPAIGGHLHEYYINDAGMITTTVEEERMYAPIKHDYKHHVVPEVWNADSVEYIVKLIEQDDLEYAS